MSAICTKDLQISIEDCYLSPLTPTVQNIAGFHAALVTGPGCGAIDFGVDPLWDGKFTVRTPDPCDCIYSIPVNPLFPGIFTIGQDFGPPPNRAGLSNAILSYACLDRQFTMILRSYFAGFAGGPVIWMGQSAAGIPWDLSGGLVITQAGGCGVGVASVNIVLT